LIAENTVDFSDFRHRFTLMWPKYHAHWHNFSRNLFFLLIIQSVFYKSLIDNFVYCSIHLVEKTNKHDTLNFLFLFRHRVSLSISDTNFTQLSQINSNFLELKRVFRDRSSHKKTKFLNDLVAEKSCRHCGQNIIALRALKPIYICCTCYVCDIGEEKKEKKREWIIPKHFNFSTYLLI